MFKYEKFIFSNYDNYLKNLKYIPIMLELEISLGKLLNTTTDALDIVVTHLENQIKEQNKKNI